MLIAFFVATALHFGLMNFEFDQTPVLVPSVSLPRSVSVILGQRKVVETPVLQTEKAKTAEHVSEEQPAAETELEKPFPQKVSVIKEKSDNPLQQPALLEKTVKKTAVEKILSAPQRSKNIEKDSVPEAGGAAKTQESVTTAEPEAVKENDSVTPPGTLQMAYPRYQSNAPPLYPGLARKRGQEGTVILQVLVNSQGSVDELEIEITSGFVLLDRAAATAVRKWLFEPGQRDAAGVPMWVRVPVTFKLEQ
jgi:protein TonB